MHNRDIATTREEASASVVEPKQEKKKKKVIVKGAKEGINAVRLSANDQDILDFMRDKGAFSSYVKRLIREEISREEFETVKAESDEVNIKLDKILELLQSNNVSANVAQNVVEEPINEVSTDVKVYSNEAACNSINSTAMSMMMNLAK